jgi:hypothetical protein
MTPPSPAEIADLLAWARRLTEAGPAADPTDRAAYLAAKTDLLTRIPTPHEHTDEDSR